MISLRNWIPTAVALVCAASSADMGVSAVKLMGKTATQKTIETMRAGPDDEGCCKNSLNKCWGCNDCGCGCSSPGECLCTTTWLVAITASLGSCAVNGLFLKNPDMFGYQKTAAEATEQTSGEEALTKITETTRKQEEGMGGCAQFFLVMIIVAILGLGGFFGYKKFDEEMAKQHNPANAVSMGQRYKAAAEDSDLDSEVEEELRHTPKKRGNNTTHSEDASDATSFSMFSDDESTQEAKGSYM